MRIKALRGFREFFPEEMVARRKVLDKICNVAKCYGFREIDIPSLESLDLLKLKSGDEIVEELFSFTDKGNRDVTLIPETTPSVSRMIGNRKGITKPVKWFSLGKIWRYEEPQAGRLREFYQLNVDIFGAPGVDAEAEVIAFSVKMLQSLGLTDEYMIRISDRYLLSESLKGRDANAVYRIIDKRSRLSDDEFMNQLGLLELAKEQEDLVLAVLDRRNSNIDKLEGLLPPTQKVKDAITRLGQLFELLSLYGVQKQCELDLSIVRGLAYYTGMVFECHDTKGDLRAIFGGGRYDELVQLFGGDPTPAVGFALGDAVLEMLMKRSKTWPNEELETDYFIILTEQKHIDTCIRIAEALRKKGFIVEWDILKRKVGAQMKYADKINARKAIFIGEDELKDGTVLVRDMVTGEQNIAPISDFLA